MIRLRCKTALTAAAALLFAVSAYAEPAINGAGSTAAAPIYKVWSQNYEKVSKTALNYDAVGSSAGVARIRERKADFGASDVAPSMADLQKDGLIVVPTVVTAAVPIINVPGVGKGQLKLTGELLARIFLGQVTAWNAPEIRELNPKTDLPAAPIRVVVRADGSGTTYHFADYLAKMSPEWASSRGAKSSLQWPDSFVAVKGSGEVAKTVKSTPGAIGYVDYNYVIDGDLNFAQLRNAAGNFVPPSVDAFVAAVRASDWYTKGDFSRSLTNMPGAASWPITMGTFAVLPRVSTTPDNTVAALRFLTWGYLNGDNLAKQANFVPLPERVQAKAYAEISKIVDRTAIRSARARCPRPVPGSSRSTACCYRASPRSTDRLGCGPPRGPLARSLTRRRRALRLDRRAPRFIHPLPHRLVLLEHLRRRLEIRERVPPSARLVAEGAKPLRLEQRAAFRIALEVEPVVGDQREHAFLAEHAVAAEHARDAQVRHERHVVGDHLGERAARRAWRSGGARHDTALSGSKSSSSAYSPRA